uniref:HDC18445 n=1 Tax=Drosophila melanogaster TaxID=7227 RepID=Q6IIF3_DROME|nr:TPA_inf: HDC18445 [Drosophila melanogaster]
MLSGIHCAPKYQHVCIGDWHTYRYRHYRFCCYLLFYALGQVNQFFPPSIAEFSHCALGPRKVGGKQRKGEQDKVTTEQEQQQQLVAGAADAVGVEEQSELGKRNWEREAGNGK